MTSHPAEAPKKRRERREFEKNAIDYYMFLLLSNACPNKPANYFALSTMAHHGSDNATEDRQEGGRKKER